MTQKLSQKDQTLASEFAMGLLEGDVLKKTEARIETDRGFAELVLVWQEKLNPLLDEVKPVAPTPELWKKIEGRTTGTEPAAARLWGSLAFWRGFSLVSSGLAAAAIAALVLVPAWQGPEQGLPLVASLNATGKAPAFLARFDPVTGGLVVRTSLNNDKETRVAELWLIPDDGVPRSLGLLNKKGAVVLDVGNKLKPFFEKGGTLAVSLEPAGGSPTGAPTGPVIASGKLQFL